MRVADLAKSFSAARAADGRYATRVGAAGSPLPTGRTTYRTYEDVQAELKALVDGNPGLVRKVVFGTSFQGREISGVEISKNVDDADGRPVFFLMALHHAREWPSMEAAMEFAHLLVRQQGDSRIADLLAKERVVILPLVNPDGFVSSRNAFDLGDQLGQNAGRHARRGDRAVRRPVRLPAQELRRRDPAAVDAVRARLGRRPQPQLRLQLGRLGQLGRRHVAELPRPRPALGARDAGRLELRPHAPGHDAHHAAQRRGARPAPARHERRGPRARRGRSSRRSATRWAPPPATRRSTATSSTTRAARPRTTPTPRRAASATRSRSARPTATSTCRTRPASSTSGPGANAHSNNQGGLKEALLIAAGAAADPANHAILGGTAPAGKVLRLHKTFETKTSPWCSKSVEPVLNIGLEAICLTGQQPPLTLGDTLDATTTVPASGSYEWHVGQSTRPFVGTTGQKEAYELTCERPDGTRARAPELRHRPRPDGRAEPRLRRGRLDVRRRDDDRRQLVRAAGLGGDAVGQRRHGPPRRRPRKAPAKKPVATRAQKLASCRKSASKIKSAKKRAAARRSCTKRYGPKKT